MPSTSRTRFAAVALVSIVSLIALSAEAAAKSRKISQSKPTAAAMSDALRNSNAGSYSSGLVMGGSLHPISRGVSDSTAGWGNVGAF
jgi:murein endopeptidase